MATSTPSARLLAGIDPNLPARPSSASSSQASDRAPSPSNSDDSQPATPSKDKMREWTFPRSQPSTSPPSALSSAASPTKLPRTAHDAPTSTSANGDSAGAKRPLLPRGHSSTTSTASPHSQQEHRASPSDFRHRPNASLAFAASVTPEIGSSASGGFSTLPSSLSPSSLNPPSSGRRLLTSPSTSDSPTASSFELPSTPADAARMLYTNVRRRGLNDLVFLVVFGGALLLFSSALLGVGYDGAGPTSATSPALAVRKVEGGAGRVVDVQIPKQFYREEEGDAEVHNPLGDSSHDDGEEHFARTPDEWEGVVDGDAEAVHAHPPPARRPASDPALFPAHSSDDDAAFDELHAEHAAVERRPPPRVVAAAAAAQEEGHGTHEGHHEGEEEHDELDVVGAEAEEEEAAEEEAAGEAAEEEEHDDPTVEDEVVDDSVSVHNDGLPADSSPDSPEDEDDDDDEPAVAAGEEGSLRFAAAAEAEDARERSALEELLDASAEEEEELVGGAGAAGGAAKPRARGVAGGEVREKRMVRRLR
ncbi:hypothetical protein JCM10207_003656 [Rhodosporidiobolus poonsookiae]